MIKSIIDGMSAAPKKIIELVDLFERNRDSYKSPDYNEAQLRVELINPFWKELGWDIDNEQGYSMAYREVVHEDSIKIGTSHKAPDYSFRIGGVRKFFLEAKKPAVNIRENPAPAYQLRRYAWSAKLPLSVLTDFEEFAVYDCRIRPKNMDKPSTARILYITYDKYDEHWDEIYRIFAKESVLKGLFDKWIESKQDKRGTTEVDAEFLKEIESWRDILARNIALRNPKLGIREMNFAVQRTIDRIIFLRMCEDRGIENYGTLQALTNGANVYQRLVELYHRADERYNSGLFHFRMEKNRPGEPDKLTPGLIMDDDLLKKIIVRLYYPDSPYEFSILPPEILGNVYERFLGKVIRLTPSHQARVEEKPEVRKAGGVYYTPGYIVDYIVRKTVGDLCEGKTPKQIEKIRILDPACGSGSFLLGAYQFLLDYHLGYYKDKAGVKDKESVIDSNAQFAEVTITGQTHKPGSFPIYMGKGGEWLLTTAEKKRILMNNIYGVDIDSQAVEVTKLSLLLKVLENENKETLQQQTRLWQEQVLPDLSGNIKCGNSLVGPDFYEQTSLAGFDEEEQYRINAFDWNLEFAEIMNAGGFDTVIGNPPYVILKADIFSEKILNYLKNYKTAEYKADLFHLFLQKGIDLLRKNGMLGYIVPNPWLTIRYSEKLRHYILDNTEIKEIVIFEHKVFEKADVHTMLLFLQHSKMIKSNAIEVKVVKSKSEFVDPEIVLVDQSEWFENNHYRFETRRIGKAGKFANDLLRKFPSLDSVVRISLGCQAYNRSKHTPSQIESRVFHSNIKLNDKYLPELSGQDVSRYIIDRKRGQWIKYGPWLHDYRSMDWLTGPRILIREISGSPPHSLHASYVEETYCNYKTILNVNPSKKTNFSMKYLLGIINSSLVSFIYPLVSNKIVARTFPRISVGDLKKIPIRTTDFSDKKDVERHDTMVKLVDLMLDLHKKLQTSRTPDEKETLKRRIVQTDRQIDHLVYELYDLTEDEIKIVESAVQS